MLRKVKAALKERFLEPRGELITGLTSHSVSERGVCVLFNFEQRQIFIEIHHYNTSPVNYDSLAQGA